MAGRALVPKVALCSFVWSTNRSGGNSGANLLAGIAITLGVGVATAMIAVATDVGDKINRELRSFGANLIVTPQEDTLDVTLAASI